ncbi:glucose 1-dehydrogenase [Mycolicibacterium neoaurum]|uniref:SDR family NAD(P)-dependent oxidoreductase n=1 Tax=Mycolicibacterium neoaurum TaxID=1795 RepID=UPI00248D1872|nr:glucose 1-dehydrogenase [Mycolicibacterium neoaurum]WBP95769.1 glucose 1-dehydrogenase [Mycolicibacterium neoaurum]WBS09452.1 glucose 1-dehydrogenase [Mycolicibacterium neoaurum]
MGRLAGKVAIVTGAAGGIGLAIAKRCADEGAEVIATDVSGPADIDSIRVLAQDVTSPDRWDEIIDSAESAYGRVDILVNNAGVAGYQDIENSSVSEWERIIGVNQTGVLYGMRAAIPAMRRTGGGAIVNVSSICGAAAVPGISAYHASKGAVITMTKNAAITYAAERIRANVILPGWIPTPMTLAQTDEVNNRYLDHTPLAGVADPDDIAWGAVFLASDEAKFITGIELPIDGGYLAR